MTTQVPALSAMTLGQASHNSVRRIGHPSKRFRKAPRPEGRSLIVTATAIAAHRYRTFLLPRGWPILRRPRRFPNTDPVRGQCAIRMASLRNHPCSASEAGLISRSTRRRAALRRPPLAS